MVLLILQIWLGLGILSTLLYLGFEWYKGWLHLFRIEDILYYIIMLTAGLPSLIATIMVIYEDFKD